MVKEKTEIALNDEELRKYNTEKVIKAVEDFGKLGKEASRTSKAFYWYIIIVLVAFFIVLIGSIYYNSSKAENFGEFMSAMFGKKELYDYKLICYDINNKSIEVNTLQNAEYFKNSFGGNCYLT